MFALEDYDYPLPQELIAQHPAARRDHARLLALERGKNGFSDRVFHQLPKLLTPGDLLVVNDTRVVSARLPGRKETGGAVEVLVIEQPWRPGEDILTRTCLLRSSKPPREGTRLLFGAGGWGEVEAVQGDGRVRIRFGGCRSVEEMLDRQGRIPLPPYIRRPEGASDLDRERYQTVYAAHRGAVAAPTAGLHFTADLIARLRTAGICLAALTLHVGYGTFSPVRSRDIREHRVDGEDYEIPEETAAAIAAARAKGRRVVAVGTTVVRALESAAGPDGRVRPREGRTELLITPGFPFRVVDALITNFHLPRSSLLFLVAAFAGLDTVRRAYAWAIERRYRFYSYGDAMLIL